MDEINRHGEIGVAAMRAGVDRKTARKYAKLGKLPSELSVPREYRTRPDAFAELWSWVRTKLADEPALQARTLFDELRVQHPERFAEGQIRTFERGVHRLRTEHGHGPEVRFAQAHRPGEAAQLDFTHATELGVTIAGQVFAHLLAVFVLPFSNWHWAIVCLSESMVAVRRSVQASLARLGHAPAFLQTDHSTGATHKIGGDRANADVDPDAPKTTDPLRVFNDDHLALMRHYGITPRTTEVGAKEQNGDVEARNGVLKRALEQALLLRGHRDFDSVAAWETFVQTLIARDNKTRTLRLAEEIAVMHALPTSTLPEFTEIDARVCQGSTLRIKSNAYSVPSRLIGETVCVRLYEERIEVLHHGVVQLRAERLRGRMQRRIDYRHVIWWLVQKPGAFERYVYRQEMFPSLVFRRAFDAIAFDPKKPVDRDLSYLRILHLAASGSESEVETALTLLLDADHAITPDAVRAIVSDKKVVVPVLIAPSPSLTDYDRLLSGGAR